MAEELKLPRLCYAEHPVSEETIKLVRGTSGYFPLEDMFKGKSTRELNESVGITDLRIPQAMMTGSMFGWDAPGANPNNYDENLSMKQRPGVE